MKKTLQKINSEGEYCAYPGITVIAKVSEEQSDLWRQVYECFANNKEACSYYTPLPYQSYHMTTCNLYTQKSISGGDLVAYVESNSHYFKAMNEQLSATLFIPNACVASLCVDDRSIKLILSLEAGQSRLNQQFADDNNVGKKVPWRYHITLGYAYQAPGIFVKCRIKSQLNQHFKKLFPSSSQAVSLKSPALFFFRDMRSYEAWDGTASTLSERMECK